MNRNVFKENIIDKRPRSTNLRDDDVGGNHVIDFYILKRYVSPSRGSLRPQAHVEGVVPVAPRGLRKAYRVVAENHIFHIAG